MHFFCLPSAIQGPGQGFSKRKKKKKRHESSCSLKYYIKSYSCSYISGLEIVLYVFGPSLAPNYILV